MSRCKTCYGGSPAPPPFVWDAGAPVDGKCPLDGTPCRRIFRSPLAKHAPAERFRCEHGHNLPVT